MSINQGIDYSGPGAACNRDPETGIRYGVISTHSLTEWFWESVENDYGEPRCPKCGNAAITIPSHSEQLPDDGGVAVSQDIPTAYEDYETARHECPDYACEACTYLFGSESAYPDEPLGWSTDEEGLRAISCLDSDAMVTRSPYFTYAEFCSPCVPGACNLDSPMEPATDAAQCFCFGHSWFEDGIAPYPVYSVATGELVQPEGKP